MVGFQIFNWIIYGELLVLPIPTRGVSLGVLSPQGRHSVTYTEHVPMKELHTVMQPACLGKLPYIPHWQGLGIAPTVHLPASLWVGTVL